VGRDSLSEPSELEYPSKRADLLPAPRIELSDELDESISLVYVYPGVTIFHIYELCS
jgi:hypothetical protein